MMRRLTGDISDRRCTGRGRCAGRRHSRGAYTLIEVLVVVTIIGILVTAAIIGVQWAVEYSRETAFVETMRRHATAAEVYRLKTGSWPGTSPVPGELPPGMDEFVDEHMFGMETPLGGNWAYAFGGPNFTAGVGVNFAGDDSDDGEDVLRARWASRVQGIDDRIDDGDPETGNFRQVDESSYFYVLK